jgi:hypothetical protein
MGTGLGLAAREGPPTAAAEIPSAAASGRPAGVGPASRIATRTSSGSRFHPYFIGIAMGDALARLLARRQPSK